MIGDFFWGSLRFPVNPQTFRAQAGPHMLTWTTVNLGGHELARGRQPKRVSWSGKLLGRSHQRSPMVREWRDPEYVSEYLTRAAEAGETALLEIGGTHLRFEASVRSFTADRGGGRGDIDYAIEFVEYRPVVVGTVQGNTPWNRDQYYRVDPRNAAAWPKTYVTGPGETLWLVAKKMYGNGDKHGLVRAANTAAPGIGDEFLPEGTVLVVPRPD